MYIVTMQIYDYDIVFHDCALCTSLTFFCCIHKQKPTICVARRLSVFVFYKAVHVRSVTYNKYIVIL